jgi:HlyD family secretion protein
MDEGQLNVESAPPPARSRRLKFIVGGAVVVLILLVIIGSISFKGKDGPHVTTEKVKREDLISKVTANGKIQAERKVDMSALVMGQIVNLAVQEGDHVKKGEFLLQIDKAQSVAQADAQSAALQAALADRDVAKANFLKARQDFGRAKKNYEGKILSQADYQAAVASLDSSKAALDATERRVEQARANLAASRDTLSKTTVRSPINGVVTSLPIKEGEVTVIGTMNNAGTELMTVSDMSTMEAILMVDETDLPAVKIGQHAVLTIDAYPNQTFDAIVTEVGASPVQANDPDLQGLIVNTDTINFKVKAKVINPPDTIRPGFSVTADILTGKRSDALAIPIQALVVRDVPGKRTVTGAPLTEQGVYVVTKGDRIAFRKVDTGITGELMIEAKSGVQLGDQIVTGPFKTLRQIKDGDRIVVDNSLLKGKKEEEKS